MAIAWPREDEELSFPVQCETDPTGSDGVVVFGHLSYPIHSPRHPIIQPEELSDLNEVVVYDHPIPSVENHQPRDRASSVDNSSDVRGGLEQQWSLEETHNQEENLLFRPHGHLTSAGVSVTWWSQNGPWVVVALAAVILLLLVKMVFFSNVNSLYSCNVDDQE